MKDKNKTKLFNSQILEKTPKKKVKKSFLKPEIEEEELKSQTLVEKHTLTPKQKHIFINNSISDASNLFESCNLHNNVNTKKNKSSRRADTEFSDSNTIVFSLTDVCKELENSRSVVLIQSVFRGYLVRAKKNLLNLKSNNNQSTINECDVIYKKKTPVRIKKCKQRIKNTSRSSSNILKSEHDFSKILEQQKNIDRENYLITKVYIINKKLEINKIKYIQAYWKIIYKKIKKFAFNQMKSVIFDYSGIKNSNSINNNSSFLYMSQVNPYQITNISNISNNFRSMISYGRNSMDENDNQSERNLNIIDEYNTHKYDMDFLNSYVKTTHLTKLQNQSINLNELQSFSNKEKNINYRSLYLNNLDRKTYQFENAPVFFKRRAMNLNKTLSDGINIGDNYDIKVIDNNLNIWKKNELNVKVNTNHIFKYQYLIPKRHFILIETKRKEKKLCLNNKKQSIIPKPNVSNLKKIHVKSRIKKTKSYSKKTKNSKNNSNNNIIGLSTTKSGCLLQNVKNNILIKTPVTIKKKKLTKKQIIINSYKVDERNKYEPVLELERKLIMEKPNIPTPVKKNKKKVRKYIK